MMHHLPYAAMACNMLQACAYMYSLSANSYSMVDLHDTSLAICGTLHQVAEGMACKMSQACACMYSLKANTYNVLDLHDASFAICGRPAQGCAKKTF